MKREEQNKSIKNWPKDERPREKLFKFGEHTLSNTELLAILLRSGVKGQSAVDLSRKILSKFSTFRDMSHTDIRDWKEFKGLGQAKIAQIKTAIEIGRRFLAENKQPKGKIKGSRDIADLFIGRMRDFKKEVFKILLLDNQNHIIETAEITEGTVNQVSPIVPYEEGKKYAHASVEEYPTQTGPCDYAFFHNKRPMAAVEGKKVSLGPQNVLQQAQRYARGFQNSPFAFGEYHLPFIYSTNGKVIWFQDLRHPLNRSREIAAIHTPNALEEFLSKDEDTARAWLKNTAIDNPSLRHYQKESIEAIEKAIAERKRSMLVAMATGTGKTFTIINLIYRLIKSGLAKRVLFLVDRRALVAQAVTALASFEAEPGLKFDKCYEVYSQRFRRDFWRLYGLLCKTHTGGVRNYESGATFCRYNEPFAVNKIRARNKIFIDLLGSLQYNARYAKESFHKENCYGRLNKTA